VTATNGTRASRLYQRQVRASRVKPSRALGCEPGEPGSAMEPWGPPMPRLLDARRVRSGVEVRWHFDHKLPTSDACRPSQVLATVHSTHPGRAVGTNTEAVRVRGLDGRALVRVRYIGPPPYSVSVSSVTLMNLAGRRDEGQVR
jgi:hypothetical protein